MSTQRPNQGFIFWPVGNGDSTTVVVGPGITFQVDLNHLDSADEDGDPHAPVIDELVSLLPKVNGKPYLSTFVLTHPDQDHCRGFARLLKEVAIGELWFTPRVFREYKSDLSDDAIALKKEAERRVKKTIQVGSGVSSGDRVRIVGYDELLQEEEFKGFPKDLLAVPGLAVTKLDGAERGTQFRAFVHAPFKDDATGERNEASLAMQVRLLGGGNVGHALLLGDLSYPTVKRIFDASKAEDLTWDVFKVVEKIGPSLPGFPLQPRDCRALFEPIDYVAFKGLSDRGVVDAVIFVDVKSGGAVLQPNQRKIKKAVLNHDVSLLVM